MNVVNTAQSEAEPQVYSTGAVHNKFSHVSSIRRYISSS